MTTSTAWWRGMVCAGLCAQFEHGHIAGYFWAILNFYYFGMWLWLSWKNRNSNEIGGAG